ncbi:MAG: Flp pilus assembly protein CpaB [Erythrobacter sp. SCN 62-14]|nr:MAG: Flp pilus assembly protein CpaB [Erythrobacter sp. SCN 62-14]
MGLSAKSKLLIFGGAGLAILFLVLGVIQMFRTPEPAVAAATPAAAPAVAIVAKAGRAIKVGETITGDMIVNLPFNPSLHQVVATPQEIIGKVAIRDIAANTAIAREWVDIDSNLAMRVPIGKRAVSIETNSEIAVAGLIRPGNVVDVQVVYPGMDALTSARAQGRSRSETVLQSIQVLAVGELVLGETGGSDGVAPPARTVTLALTPDEVGMLALAKNTGLILLSLRNPLDVAMADTIPFVASGGADFDPYPNFEPPAAAPARSSAPRPPARKPKPSAPKAQVELNIGGRKQTLTAESAS